MPSINLVPIMTSDTTPSGVVTYSGNNWWDGFWAFTTTNAWITGSHLIHGSQFLQYEFPIAENVNEIKMTAYQNGPDDVPTEFSFYGSTTGAFAGEQVFLLSRVGEPTWTVNETRSYPFTNTNFYKYYRLIVYRTDSMEKAVVARLQLIGPIFPRTQIDIALDVATNPIVEQSNLTIALDVATNPIVESSNILLESNISITKIKKEVSLDVSFLMSGTAKLFVYVRNEASGNNGKIRGNVTLVGAGHYLLYADVDPGYVESGLALPTDHDWCIIETFNINGLANTRGISFWTDKAYDFLNQIQIIETFLAEDNFIQTYLLRAIYYAPAGLTASIYEGTETRPVELAYNIIATPDPFWLLPKDPLFVGLALLNIETISGTNNHDIQLLSTSADNESKLYRTTGGQFTLVDIGTGTDVTLNIPDTTTVDQYVIFSPLANQVKFLGVAKHSKCEFLEAVGINTLASLYTDGSSVTSFGWSGVCNATSANSAWAYCNITDFPDIDFTNCSDFTKAFRYFSGTINSLDVGTATVTDMFEFATGSITTLDASQLLSAAYLFRNANCDITTVDLTSATNYSYAFESMGGSLVITTIIGSAGTNFTGCFKGATIGAVIPVLNYTSATVVSNIFENATINADIALNFGSVTSLNYAFYNANINGNLNITMSNITSLTYTFKGASISVPLTLNSGSVSNWLQAFYQTTIGDTLVINTENATNLDETFRQASGAGTINNININKASGNCEYMLGWATINVLTFTSNLCTDFTYAFAAYNPSSGTIAHMDMSNNPIASHCFTSVTRAVPPTLDTSKITRATGMFNYFTGPTLPALDFSNITGTGVYDGAGSCFSNCTAQITSLNTTGMRRFLSLFNAYLYTGTIPTIDTSAATTMNYMFQDCKATCTSDIDSRSSTGQRASMFNRCSFINPTPAQQTDLGDADGALYTYTGCA